MQKLVKDESDNVQLKYDLSSNNVQISYCVTVLERNKALEWLKKYRLPEFIKSGLYAEYKLSKTLSAAQVITPSSSSIICSHGLKASGSMGM